MLIAILLSCRVSRHTEHSELVAGAVAAPLPLPSLVLYGGKDTDVPPAMTRELMATLDPAGVREIYLPLGGHRVPNLGERVVEIKTAEGKDKKIKFQENQRG